MQNSTPVFKRRILHVLNIEMNITGTLPLDETAYLFLEAKFGGQDTCVYIMID